MIILSLLLKLWAFLLPYIGPVLAWAVPWLGRARTAAGEARQALGVPAGAGTTIAVAAVVAVAAAAAAGLWGWQLGRDRKTETAAAIRAACDIRILEANERALKAALRRAAEAEGAVDEARAVSALAEAKARDLAAEIDELARAKPDVAKVICFPPDIAKKLNGR